MGRSQLSIQELQELAEKQRKQILYSSKELMDKQQLLMKMHNDFRTRLKIQNGIDPATKSPRTNHPKEVGGVRGAPQAPVAAAGSKLEKPVAGAAVVDSGESPSPRTSPRPVKSGEKREQDQYAKMLRETYNNMGKLQNRGKILKEVDIKKLSNIELGKLSLIFLVQCHVVCGPIQGLQAFWVMRLYYGVVKIWKIFSKKYPLTMLNFSSRLIQGWSR